MFIDSLNLLWHTDQLVPFPLESVIEHNTGNDKYNSNEN